MAMYHSWGSQNAWLRQIHGDNPIYINRGTAAALDIEDGDWVWLTSHHGRIKGRAKLMEGVNGATVWTWNAIGKRAGAWNLSPDAPEAKTGVLLNHTISELLPEKGDGMRWSNSDPVTGQAAWYDLRVRLEKAAADEAQESWPQFDAIRPLDALPARPAILRYGLRFSRAWRRTHTDGGGT
jgi:anaerobic selenocysteine-containing dehydrogenase